MKEKKGGYLPTIPKRLCCRWEKWEDKIVLKKAESDAEIAEKLGRTINSIRVKRFNLLKVKK
ncbi:hypothetical protein KKC45_01760 [Patescibacteria group bacterium]|nr:hypothetical protein [Patescibacteria group bacterium]